MAEHIPPQRRKTDDDGHKDKKSESFESELNDFFKDRAIARSIHVSDAHKKDCSESRTNNCTEPDPSMSGCCMTGCSDCPWGYIVPPLTPTK